MSEEAVAVVGRVVVASGLAAAAALPPSLLYNPALSLPCLLLLYSTLSCLVPSLLYNPDLSLLPRFFYPPFYFTRTISCSTLLSSLSVSLSCSCLTLYLSRLARPTPGRQYFSILHITILSAHLVFISLLDVPPPFYS